MPAKKTILTDEVRQKLLDQLTALNCLGQTSKNRNLEICITHLVFEIGATLQVFGSHCQPFSEEDFERAFDELLKK